MCRGRLGRDGLWDALGIPVRHQGRKTAASLLLQPEGGDSIMSELSVLILLICIFFLPVH